MSISTLVAKPILACNARCRYCASRLALHRSLGTQQKISIDDWFRVLDQAVEVGVSGIHVSGGEPTLFGGLFDLLQGAKERGLDTNLNSNGFRLADNGMVRKLQTCGVRSVTISIPSHRANLHDELKDLAGIHDKSVTAMQAVGSSGIDIYAQTILMKRTLVDFAEFLDWLLSMNTCHALFVSYVEGTSAEDRPTVDDIQNFRDVVVPKAGEVLSHHLPGTLAEKCIRQLECLFSLDDISDDEVAMGIYSYGFGAGCRVPFSQALVLANGDVHPCNAVEYFHRPIAGNVLEKSLGEIVNGPVYAAVQRQGTEWCKRCPARKHVCLQFRDSGIFRGPTGDHESGNQSSGNYGVVSKVV